MLDGSNFSDNFTRLNPLGQVPALVIPDKNNASLNQSSAIIAYLDEVYPQPPILPEDPFLRAKARGIADTIVSQVQPIQNLGIFKRLKAINAQVDTKIWARDWITDQFGPLEQMINSSCGKYCVDDNVTLADICLVPQVYNAKRFGVDMSKFPTISLITDRLMELEPFQTSAPERMPDCPNT